MKKYLFVLIILLIFSCTPKKIIQQSQIQKETVTKNDIVDTKSSQVEIKATTTDNSKKSNNTVTKTTNYDITKPIVDGTGRSPVISESITTNNGEEATNINTTVNSSKKEELAKVDKSKINDQSKAEIKNTETPKTPAVKYWLWIIIIISGAIGSFFVYKNFKRIKTILGLV